MSAIVSPTDTLPAGKDDLLRDKALRLFSYLREVTELRFQVQRDCERYEDLIWWAELPKEKECYCVAWDLHRDPAIDAWIRVERPKRKPPPMPGSELRIWLNERDLYDSSLDAPPLRETVITTVESKAVEANQEFETVTRKLSDNPEIEKQWERYVENEWWPWAAEDRRLSSVQAVYNQLFAVYQKQKRLGEAFEVVIGAGLLTWHPPHGLQVKRHIVAMQASIDFDESTGVISIDAAADGARPSLEQEMLEPQDRPHSEFQNAIVRELEEIGDELWSMPKLTTLITAYFQQLSPEGTLDLTLNPQDGGPNHAKPEMHFAPAVIVRRRTDRNLVRIFQEICRQISSGGDIPQGVQRLVEIHDDCAGNQESALQDTGCSKVEEMYLPLPTNEAQEQIVERLESSQGILVQGPPGTGKSHTITNLVCHLLATGRRVLITSHTARALKVLKGYANAHAPGVAPLCVSLLGDDSQAIHELEDSVQSILGRMHSWDSERNRSQICSLQKDLHETRGELAEALAELRQLRSSEAEEVNLGFGEYKGTPRSIAERIAGQQEEFGWLQSFDPSGDPPPLTSSDALDLLYLVGKFDTNGSHPDYELPERTSVISSERVDNLIRQEQNLKLRLQEAGLRADPGFAQLMNSAPGLRAKLKQVLRQYLNEAEEITAPADSWLRRAVCDVANHKHEFWRHVQDITSAKCGEIEANIAQVSEFTVTGIDGHEASTLAADAGILKKHIDGGGSLGLAISANPFASRPLKAAQYIAKTVRVNGRLCSTAETLAQLLDWIQVTTTLDRIELEWADIEPLTDHKPFHQRFHEFKRKIGNIQRVLALRAHTEAIREQSRLLGLPAIPLADMAQLRRYLDVIEAVEIADNLRIIERDLETHIEELNRISRRPKAHYLISEAASAIKARDAERFTRIASEIDQARDLLRQYRRRSELLSNLSCSGLKAALTSSAADPVWDERLKRFAEAWECCRATSWLDRFANPRRERTLLFKIDSCEQRIRARTQELTACKAWEFVLARLRHEEREHLSAWRLAIKKVGKGTGKYAPQYRKEARQHLEQCRSAIPAWVMPIYRVAETIHPQPGMFDVVVVDEASQSGPEALFLLYIAKKIVIVGDDQQISPESVGLDRDAVNSLRERHIKDLPHEDALGLDNSLFDQAEIRFSGRIRLREHFRCMPEIIQFSNSLCYQAEPLIPLRQYGASRLNPVTTRHIPNGYVKGSHQRIVNPPEAEAIAQQIEKCLEDVAYAGKTIGVISLQGSAQADLIRDLLMDRVGVHRIQERNIVCGDAYAFQGDERDVIFLSMVAAANHDRRIGTLAKDSDKRRFNVAASRARDQMWLFHSVTAEELSSSCYRHRLLEYCLNPTVGVDTLDGFPIHELRKKAVDSDRTNSRPPVPFDSWFEVDVFLRITDRGYRVLPQYELAGKRIDLLVEGMRGRLAVECDGDAWHNLERLEQDVGRQRMLERCGLEFWRLRASTFYRDQEQAMAALWDLLESRGIRPGATFKTTDQTNCSSAAKTGLEDAAAGAQEPEEDGAEVSFDQDALQEGSLGDEFGDTSPDGFHELLLQEFCGWNPRPVPDPHTAPLAEVMQALLEIIEAEGPILRSRAYALYNRAAGSARLGRQTINILTRAVNRATRLEKLTHDNGRAIRDQSLQLAGRAPIVPRKRGQRRLNDIPPSEIAAVRERARSSHPYYSEEQMVRHLANLYGVGRLTTQTRKLLLG